MTSGVLGVCVVGCYDEGWCRGHPTVGQGGNPVRPSLFGFDPLELHV
jgi:hypothetical protein